MPAKNFMYSSCKNKDCEHNAPEGQLCRYCRGRAEDAALVAERKREALAQGLKGRKLALAIRPLLRAMKIVPKKSKPKTAQTKPQKLVPVAIEDVKVGMVTHLGERVISGKPFTGRTFLASEKQWVYRLAGTFKLRKGWKVIAEGQDGYLLKTDKGDVFYPAGSTVWTVRRPKLPLFDSGNPALADEASEIFG